MLLCFSSFCGQFTPQIFSTIFGELRMMMSEWWSKSALENFHQVIGHIISPKTKNLLKACCGKLAKSMFTDLLLPIYTDDFTLFIDSVVDTFESWNVLKMIKMTTSSFHHFFFIFKNPEPITKINIWCLSTKFFWKVYQNLQKFPVSGQFTILLIKYFIMICR